MSGRLVLVGPHAREPVQWAALEQVCEILDLEGIAIAPALADLEVEEHRQTRQVDSPPPGSRFVQVQALPPGRRSRRALGILRQLRSIRPDVVVLTAEPHERVVLDALAALSVYRRPRVVAVAVENRVTLPRGRRGRAIRLLWRRIDAIASAATATTESFRAAGMPESVGVSPLGLPVEDPQGPPAGKPARDRLRVGYVGRLVPEKGVPDLVEAVARTDGVELVLAGPGPLEQELRNRAEAEPLRGRLEVLGLTSRDDVWRLLADVDVLALLSRARTGWAEQFGYVLAEAMAVGTPLLGSSSGAIPEVIGPAGLVVPEGSTEAAAEALRRLRDDAGLRARLGAAARERYLAEFSIDAYARKLAALIAAAR